MSVYVCLNSNIKKSHKYSCTHANKNRTQINTPKLPKYANVEPGKGLPRTKILSKPRNWNTGQSKVSIVIGSINKKVAVLKTCLLSTKIRVLSTQARLPVPRYAFRVSSYVIWGPNVFLFGFVFFRAGLLGGVEFRSSNFSLMEIYF